MRCFTSACGSGMAGNHVLWVSGLLVLAGCSSYKADVATIESNIEDGIYGQAHVRTTVECPSKIDWKPGGQFQCLATDENTGETVRVTVTMQKDNGRITWSTD